MTSVVGSRLRRAIVLVASSALLILLLLRNPPEELRRRVRFIGHYAAKELPVRRLGGSSAAFDRRYFFFLESARRKLPPGTVGVAIYMRQPTEAALYLASYQLAPVPVLLSPRKVPPRWIAAIYGPSRPAGWRLIAPVSDGALMAPGP